MKKILIITLEFPPQIGGIATYVHEFALNLPPDQVMVLAPKNRQSRIFDQKAPYKIVRKNPYWPKFIWPRWLRLAWQAFWLCRREKIRLILVHHALPAGYAGLIVKKLLKIPYLVFAHGTDVQHIATRPWKRKMFSKVIQASEQMFFNSQALKRRAAEIFPDWENKFSVLYPCPNPNLLLPPPAEEINKLKSQLALEGKKVMLSVGRLGEGKGYTHLLRILPKLLKEVPNLVWLIIGDGPKRAWLLDTAEKNSLQSVIRYLGEMTYENLKNYYYLADLFVLLTHPDEGREEGLGLVFLEAAACGLPVVAGKSGGVEEGVVNVETGLVVDVYQGDKNIIEAIVKLLQDDLAAKQIGGNAKVRIQTEFQWPRQIAALEPWLK